MAGAAAAKKPPPKVPPPALPPADLPASADPYDPDLDDTLDALLAGSNVDLDEVRDLAATRASNVGQGAVWSLLQGILDGAANLQSEELDTYLADLPAAIVDRWGQPDADRIGAIVDMTTQGAIGAASDAALSDPESIEGMPYRAFFAVLDSSTTMLCSACGEPPVVLPAGHPWWADHSPPLHYECRSWLCGLSAEQAGQLGIRGGPDVDADEGFGNTGFYWGYAPVETDYEDLMPGEGEAASALQCMVGVVETLYSEDQPRDDHGRFGEGGGAGKEERVWPKANSDKPVAAITAGGVPHQDTSEGDRAYAKATIDGMAKRFPVAAWVAQNVGARVMVGDLHGAAATYDWQRNGIILGREMSAAREQPFKMPPAGSVNFHVSGDGNEDHQARLALVHELGHALSNSLHAEGLEARGFAAHEHAASKYAETNAREYFAESFSAYNRDSAGLRAWDPVGHDMIEKALGALERKAAGGPPERLHAADTDAAIERFLERLFDPERLGAPDQARDDHGRYAPEGGGSAEATPKAAREFPKLEVRAATVGEFKVAFDKAFPAGSRFENFVTHYSPEQLATFQRFVTTDGKVGVAVHDHGDGRIEGTALFNNDGPRGAGLAMLQHAVEHGGVNYAECFGGTLDKMYAGKGFRETARYPFDASQAPGWNQVRDDQPDYILMKYAPNEKLSAWGGLDTTAKLIEDPARFKRESIDEMMRDKPGLTREQAESWWGAANAQLGLE